MVAIAIPFLSICPRIRKRGDALIVSTSWVALAMTLGLWIRKVVVAPDEKLVTLRDRYLWLIPRERNIPFPAIGAVTYGYENHSPGSDLTYTNDSWDQFSVGLRLKDDNDIHLFSFFGEGTFTNNAPFADWMYWSDFMLDFSGTQEHRSQVLVNLLSKLIRVTVVPPKN